MLKFTKIALGVAVLACSLAAEAKLAVPTFEELPVLKPEANHENACTRTSNSFLRAHYKAINVDNEFTDKVTKQFLYMIDYNKTLFTKQEVDEIYSNRTRMQRALLLCDLSYPYELYTASMAKRFKKYSFFLDKIKKDQIDLTTHDEVQINRKDADYFADEQSLEKHWVNELKNEYISQLLNDKTKEEAKKRLLRRYDAALSKLAQTRSEDVFSVFENSFATAIDPHTSYLSPDDTENFNDNLNLSLEGIGAVLTSEDEYTVINSILPGSPAEATKKLKAKDKIVGVRQADGSYEDIIGWRLNEVVKKIKGPKGTKVTLDIEREDGSQITSFSVDLIRDKIRLQDSEAKIEMKKHGDKNIAVLKIKSFYTNLHQDIKKEINRVKSEGTKIDALIVDLRNNGGGLLPEATLSSGLFIKQGPIVLVRDARGNVIPQFDTDEGVAYDGPLVVLINRLSASSSEIMAAALSDYGRALLVGDTSFGKGTVQQSKPLARVYDFDETKLGSIHYTIAKFYRINGGSTQLKGVSPDLYLPTNVDTKEFGESTENNALPWDKINAVPYEGYLNIAAYVPELKRLSDERSEKNEAFKLIKSDLDRYYEFKEKNKISVNLEERKKRKAEDDAYNLKTTNERLALMGKEPVKNVKDLADDFEFEDFLLNEVVAIASDFADAQKKKLYESKTTPVLTKYQVERDELSVGQGASSPPGAAAMPARPEAKKVLSKEAFAKAEAILKLMGEGATCAEPKVEPNNATNELAATKGPSVFNPHNGQQQAHYEVAGLADSISDKPQLPVTAQKSEVMNIKANQDELAMAPKASDKVEQSHMDLSTATASVGAEHSGMPQLDKAAAKEQNANKQDEVKQDKSASNEQKAVKAEETTFKLDKSNLPRTRDGQLYSQMTATGEINNMELDGSLVGFWRTDNEDDTFLRVSDDEFEKFIKDYAKHSKSAMFQDDGYPTIFMEKLAEANNDGEKVVKNNGFIGAR